MRKLVYSRAVLVSVALVSCGGNKAAEATDTDTLVAAEEVVDTLVDTAAQTETIVEAAAAEVVEAPAADSAK